MANTGKTQIHAVEVNNERIEVHTDTGNVFQDLGFEDAPEMTFKAQVAKCIQEVIQAQSITQKRAAELTGLKGPDISNIVNFRLDGISIERLFKALNRLGYGITVEVAREKEKDARTVLQKEAFTA